MMKCQTYPRHNNCNSLVFNYRNDTIFGINYNPHMQGFTSTWRASYRLSQIPLFVAYPFQCKGHQLLKFIMELVKV